MRVNGRTKPHQLSPAIPTIQNTFRVSAGYVFPSALTHLVNDGIIAADSKRNSSAVPRAGGRKRQIFFVHLRSSILYSYLEGSSCLYLQRNH